MVKQAAENPVNPTTLPNLNLVTRICFARNGRLFDCGFYDADAWVCLSQNSERKYDWIEYEDGTRLGRKGQCASKDFSKVE